MSRAALLLFVSIAMTPLPVAAEMVVGSKKFTESVLLGELVTQLLSSHGIPTVHRRELGGTRVLWNALRSGDIDLYPEYTGTLREEIFSGEHLADMGALRARLAELGIDMSAPLGFDNRYALGMQRQRAASLGISRISQLTEHPSLTFGFSNEFLDRDDGWPGLRDRYALPQQQVRGMDHHLAYRGLASGAIDVSDLYSTDPEIAYYDLVVLDDDRGFFPDYKAVFLYRRAAAALHPRLSTLLARLAGRLPDQTMIAMNAAAKLEKVPEPTVAAGFLEQSLGLSSHAQVPSPVERFWRHTREHLALVGISLSAAVALAIPLGIVAARRHRLGQIVLAVAGMIQTIPALALLVFMIPLLGIGGLPAVVALFLYSLLPIIRNTYAGLHDIAAHLRESAQALGLPPGAILRRIELPLAARSILAGIKTAAVINVGTATLGALIGAGGYGQPILTGIRLDDLSLILQGAIPAALLALLVQAVFDLGERLVVPRGLRLH
jgi:osmoprotectant transport system permease protein